MDDLQRINGLFVGQLNDEELKAFYAAVKEGRACREYHTEAALLLGLASVRVYEAIATVNAPRV